MFIWDCNLLEKKGNIKFSFFLLCPYTYSHTDTHFFVQVSKAAADLMAYCEAHAKEDPLVTPMPSTENPFREKKLFCVIL